MSDTNTNFYHPSCHKQYTAVKRPSDVPSESPAAKTSRIETRRYSVIPKSDQQGLLKGKCIFCGMSRKKRSGKEEPRTLISTIEGCNTLAERADSPKCKNERIKSLVRSGVDLIAKEAEYHRSCRATFLKETDASDRPTTSTSTYHSRAFVSLCSDIQRDVMENKRSILVSTLLEMYKQRFLNVGGRTEDVSSYASQNLLRKLREKFRDRIGIKLADQRRGNFIFSSTISETDAKANLLKDAEYQQQDDKLIWAARHLRSQIMMLPKSRTPNPVTVQNLKDCAPDVPRQVQLFFETLLGGASPSFSQTSRDAMDRKVTCMASDAIYNVSHGTVKPWKHTALGLGLASLTGSKLSMQILNRAGHSISYSETKGLETEFAYSIAAEGRNAPDGIRLDPNLATGSVWDNNDANIETLDGKQTLHATVGHTYQNILPDNAEEVANPLQFREGRNRRRFDGYDREIPPFRKSLKKAQFTINVQQSNVTSITDGADAGTTSLVAPVADPEPNKYRIEMDTLDFYWFWKLRNGNIALYSGFISQFIQDSLPLQRICYMDPIPRSPTNNDVVRETMLRSIEVAKETGQSHAVVTYDLAIALKAYQIQAIESPTFNNLLIMLGNFHIELAFYGAVGTYICDSGIEYILSEADILAEGSMMGFLKGKFYNRCTRIHELLAIVLERKLYERFLVSMEPEDIQTFNDVMTSVPEDPSLVKRYLDDPVITKHLAEYDEFFTSVLDGLLGSTAQFWGIYIFLMNRLHRELQRSVKTNDVGRYIKIFPILLDVFFALNRPNYARWGTLFLQKLDDGGAEFRDILERGAFSIRRTRKDFSRSAVDLSLEQTVNRDATSQLKGIVAFRNSESAMRRWSLTMTQRAMAVSELRTFAGLEIGENAAAQCHPSRVKKDNQQMATLSKTIDEFCNPFSDDLSSGPLVNLATGQTATKATETYLLSTLKRGTAEQNKFKDEWASDAGRFLKPVKRTKVLNFAAENVKKKGPSPASKTAKTNTESLRDMFIRLMVIIAQKTTFNLKKVLEYPIIAYPLALAHSDGTYIKTPKAALLNKLEGLQTEPLTDFEIPMSSSQIYDGGLLLHSVLSQVNVGASYASIARTVLSVLCSGRGTEVHVCFDKYVEMSVKESERRLRGAIDLPYIITGADQTTRQSGQKLLSNGNFKNELAKFVMKEWQKNHYFNIFNGKTLVASYGGDCLQYDPDENESICVTSPVQLQADHEEADTLVAFHATNVSSSTVIVRASDTDVLVILIGILGQQRPEVRSAAKVIMDCGQGNSRRYINVTNIAQVLEEHQIGLARALPGFHAFTGCDFTSAFFR